MSDSETEFQGGGNSTAKSASPPKEASPSATQAFRGCNQPEGTQIKILELAKASDTPTAGHPHGTAAILSAR